LSQIIFIFGFIDKPIIAFPCSTHHGLVVYENIFL